MLLGAQTRSLRTSIFGFGEEPFESRITNRAGLSGFG